MDLQQAGVYLGRKEILDFIAANCEICDPIDHSLQGYWLSLDDYELLRMMP